MPLPEWAHSNTTTSIAASDGLAEGQRYVYGWNSGSCQAPVPLLRVRNGPSGLARRPFGAPITVHSTTSSGACQGPVALRRRRSESPLWFPASSRESRTRRHNIRNETRKKKVEIGTTPARS